MERVMEYILAIAKFKSVSKAAENLFISQPALSAIVKKMKKNDWVLNFLIGNTSLCSLQMQELYMLMQLRR